jgi:hypothetical protein
MTKASHYQVDRIHISLKAYTVKQKKKFVKFLALNGVRKGFDDHWEAYKKLK